MAEVHPVNHLHVRYTYSVPYWPTAFSNLSPLLKTDDIRPSESLHAMQHTPVDPASTRLVLIDIPRLPIGLAPDCPAVKRTCR